MNILASKRAFFAGILLFGLLAMTARSATDPDLWWHLRTGEWIVEHGHVPHTDPFSFTRAGSPWVSHEWLSEITLFELWNLAGPSMLIIFSAIITSFGFLLLYFRTPGKPHWAAAATVLGAWASAPSWGARPQMFTFTLASLLLWLLERGKRRPLLLLWIPPLFLLWLNLHAGFALGPALLLLYALGLIFETASGTTPWREARLTILRVLLVTLACMALVPLNPSGTELYRYPLDTLRSHGMRSYIVEWFSPDFHRPLYFPLLLVFLLLIASFAVSRSPLKGRVLLPLLFTAIAAFDAVRHIPIFILVAIPVIAAALDSCSTSASLATQPPSHRRGRFFFNPITVALLAFFALSRWISLAHNQPASEAALFPEKAVTFLQTNPQPPRAFIFYDWGGYAIWKLHPQYLVFADGRADLYGDALLRDCIETVPHLRLGWEKVLDNYSVQTILIPPNTALAQALLLNPKWTQRYRDQQASVFVRSETSPARTSENSPPPR